MSGEKGKSTEDFKKSTRGLQDEIQTMRSEIKALKRALAGHEKISSSLKEARELCDTLTSNMLDGLVIIDWDGNILFANEAAYRIVGLKPRKSRKGLNMAQFIHPEDLQKALELHMLAKAGKAGSLTQYRIITHEHDQKWIEAIGRRVSFGGQDASLVTFRDITERKMMEERLQLSEKKFSEAFLSSPDSMVISDLATGRIIDANKALVKRSGFKRKELIGKTTLDLNLWANQHDRERFVKGLSAGNLTKSSQVKLTGKDGQVKDVLLSASLFKVGDKTYMLSLARDITEQKKAEKALIESEERFRALHEASCGGIGIHDKGVILDCNHGLADITGYSIDELIGMNGLDLIAPKWRDQVMQNIVGGYDKFYEVEGVRKDGTVYPLEIIGKNIPYHGRTVRVTEFRDLSGRKQDQEALRESEDRYRKITGAITDYIYTVHVEQGRAVSTEHSPACEVVTGYTVEEFKAKPFLWFNMVVEDDQERVREYFQKVLIGKHEGPIEHRIYHKDGSIHWVTNMPVVHRNEAGAVISYDGVVSDITERKNWEEAIWQRQAKLDSIFRAAPTGIGVVKNRILQDVNHRICEMTGYSREELVGTPARIFYPSQEEHDYVGTEKYRQIHDKGTGTVETHWKRKDGTIIDILLSSSPIIPGDLLAGVTFTALDITERKRSEEALQESQKMLRLVLDTIPVRVFWKDKGSNYMGCNLQFASDAGLASTEEVIGKNDFDLNWSGQADLYREYDHTVISTGEPKLNYVQPEIRSDGSQVWLRTSKVPLLDARGDVDGVLGIYEDITESIHAEEALKESEERYRLMAELTGKLVYDYDVPTGHITWQGAISQITGYSPEEFGAVDAKAFNEMIHPEDRIEVVVTLEAALKEWGPYNAEYRLLRKDGTYIYVEDHGVFLPDGMGRAVRLLGSLGDISVRKQAEEETREAERRYRTLFESANDAIFIMSEDRFIECNQMTLKMFGCESKDDIFGHRPWEFSPNEQPDGRPSTEKALEFINAAFDGTPQHFYWKHMRKDGTPFDAEVSLNSIELGDQKFLQAMVRDITKRMKAEEALREKTQELDRFFNIALDLLCIADTGGNFRLLNKAWEKTLGYSHEELMSGHFFDFIHPDDIQSTHDVVAKLASQKEVVNFVNRYRCKDGSYRFIEWRSAPSGNVIYAAARDITDRMKADEALRQSEEQYRTIFESTATGNIISAEDTTILLANSNFERLTGYSKDEMEGKMSWTSFVAGEDLEMMKHYSMMRRTKPGSVPNAYEFRAINRDGKIRNLYMSVALLPGTNVSVSSCLDITERKKAEAALRESEERYHSLFEDSHAVMLLIQPDTGQIVDANPAACVYYGYTKQELTAKNISEINTLTPEQIFTEMQRAKEHEQRSFFFKHRLSNGDFRDVEVFSGPIKISGQSLLFSIVHDTTERKKAEAALRESEERFRGIAVNLPGGVFQFFARRDGEMGLSYVSENALELLGLSNDPHDFFPQLTSCIAPEDRDKFLASINDAINSVGTWDFEARYIKSTGEEMFFRGISEPVETEDGLIFNGVILDITERKRAEKSLKESEERFRSLIQSSLDLIVIMDENALITYESPSMERVLRYPPGSMIGKNPLDFMHPDDVARVAGDLAEVFENVNTGVPTEFRFKRADGAWVDLEAIGNNLVDYPGINGVVITARDITERKKAEEERMDMERRMLHAQKLESLGVMAGGIAHDFNNLLMAILGNLDLARLDLSPVSRSRPFIDQAIKAGRRAADLTNQMLAYSGKGRFDLKPFDLSELVQELAHLLKASISKTVTLNLQMQSNLPSIVADPSQIQQIIMNLIVNASEAVGEHPGVVTITTGALECDQDYLQGSRLKEKPNPGTYVFFEVSDTGCGMDDETKDRLFDPFFTTKFTGRGLGMAAVLGIVSGHKGAIMVESEPGEGTTIRVMFPASQAKRTPKGIEYGTSAVGHVDDAAAPASGMVLIADDEDMVLDLCRTMVERLGYNVITAKDGEEAVKIFHEHAGEIVCVILDLTMPKLDGLAAYHELRRIKPDVKVIISSGYDEQDTTMRFAGKGVAGFIMKPYQLSSLDTELTRVLKDL